MPLTIINGPFIRAGESLSEPIDCTAGQVVRITMPGAWDGDAVLSFQFSTDGILYNDMFTPEGKEVMLRVVPGTGVPLSADKTFSIAWIKFRSGHRDGPIVQSAEREFAVALLT
jgi:hypothetical protein